jgi:hypothetical protein
LPWLQMLAQSQQAKPQNVTMQKALRLKIYRTFNEYNSLTK